MISSWVNIYSQHFSCNCTTKFDDGTALYEFSHWNSSYVEKILSHQIKGYKQINVK